MKAVVCSKIRSSNKLQRKFKISGKGLYVKFFNLSDKIECFKRLTTTQKTAAFLSQG